MNPLLHDAMQRILLIILLLLAVLSGSCSNESQAPAALRIGYLPVLDSLPLHVALREGLFKSEGLAVTLIPFNSGHERDVALQSRGIDASLSDMLKPILMQQQGLDIRFLALVYSTTPGQRFVGLAVSPEILSHQGMTVGMSRASTIELVLDHMEQTPGLRGMDLNRVEVGKMPLRFQMLMERQLDSAVLAEPLLTLAENRGCSVLATDEWLDLPIHALTLVDPEPDVARALVRAYTRAVHQINADPERYRSLMIEVVNIPESLHADFPVYRYPEPRLPSDAELKRIQEWLKSRGMLQGPLSYDRLVVR